MSDPTLSPSELRAARAENPKMRDRDLADKLGIAEAQLIAAQAGVKAVQIAAHPDRLMPEIEGLGEVMALTRNESCVSEKTGAYANYHSGAHASMILNDEIDMRFFPSEWVTAFAVQKPTEDGVRRSLQVFDAAGDAIHKVFLKQEDRVGAWESAVARLQLDEQSELLQVAPRKPVEAPKADPERREVLQKEWARMTDTHQFMRLTAKLKMNRLGAYRIAGAPHVRQLQPGAVDAMLTAVNAAGIEVMVFVGNRGCIQIHSGPLQTLRPMGPWLNVLDPRFNLHLRGDHIAEVWAVAKPTQRGMAVSVEGFDSHGALILQVFGVGKEGRDSRPAWREIVAGLPNAEAEDVAQDEAEVRA